MGNLVNNSPADTRVDTKANNMLIYPWALCLPIVLMMWPGIVVEGLEPSEKATTLLTGVTSSYQTNTVSLCLNVHGCSSGCRSTTRACNCDEYCHFFDDCCQNVLCDIRSSLNVFGIKQKQIGCVRPVLPNSKPISPGGVYMITKCTDFVSHLAMKCHEPNFKDMQSMIPVSENKYGLTFRNIYCALCNGILLEDITLWSLTALCDEYIEPLLLRASLSESLDVINVYCPMKFEPPVGIASGLGTRPCHPDMIDFTSCFLDTPRDVFNRCKGYTAYVIDQEGIIYRNPDCYICSNPPGLDVKLDCYSHDIPLIYREIQIETTQPGIVQPTEPVEPVLLPPISVLVDFSGNSKLPVVSGNYQMVWKIPTVTCEPNQVYDPFEDKCRTLLCPEGYTLNGNQCIIAASKTECSGNIKINVDVSYHAHTCNLNTDVDEIVGCLPKTYLQTHFIIKNETRECVVGEIDEYVLNVELLSSIIELENSFDATFLPNEQSELYDLCSVTSFTLDLRCDRVLSDCTDLLTLTNVSIGNMDNSTLVISQNSTFSFLGGMFSLQYDLIKKEEKFRKLITAEVCNTDQLSCALVILNASLFTNYSNDTLLYKPTGEIYTPNEYLYTRDGQIEVCSSSFLERKETRNKTQTGTQTTTFLPSQTILSLVGCIISMTALLVTFVTYCVFSKLRTRATKAIMNLVAALFIAQLVFLLGAGSTNNVHSCAFIAALLHYLWLCTFTWSMVLSFDLNQTFSHKMAHPNHEKNTIPYKYLLYGWLTPVIVIAPCLVLHLCACTEIPFQYGNEEVCWIFNHYANLVAFGGPLALCLFVNVALFCNTTWNIHATRTRTRMVQNKSEMVRMKEELLIYIRIATLMGFTWIFAFSAAFSGVPALWVIYIVINSLQGFYIFLAFTFKRKIGRLWAIKLGFTKYETSVDESDRRKANKSTTDTSLKAEQHELTKQTYETLNSIKENDTSTV